MRWFDNKCVQLVSTYCSSKDAMGEVDLADMLIALYCSPMKSKRRYLKVLIHVVDTCKVNSLILYRRFADQLYIPKKNQINLLTFSSKIAAGLTMES